MRAPIESIKREIYYPTPSLKVKIQINIGGKDLKGYRRKFLRDWIYKSDKYNDVNELSTIFIDTADYLVLETFMPADKRMGMVDWKAKSVYFSYDNIYYLESICQQSLMWLYNENDSVFESDKTTGEPVRIQRNAINLQAVCDSTHMALYTNPPLTLTPTIRTHHDGGREKAVMLSFGKDRIEADSMNFYQMTGFTGLLSHLDLCSACTSIVNQTIITTPFFKSQMKK
jgi:hypothetical protein